MAEDKKWVNSINNLSSYLTLLWIEPSIRPNNTRLYIYFIGCLIRWERKVSHRERRRVVPPWSCISRTSYRVSPGSTLSAGAPSDHRAAVILPEWNRNNDFCFELRPRRLLTRWLGNTDIYLHRYRYISVLGNEPFIALAGAPGGCNDPLIGGSRGSRRRGRA